jgi:hypothetical protein
MRGMSRRSILTAIAACSCRATHELRQAQVALSLLVLGMWVHLKGRSAQSCTTEIRRNHFRLDSYQGESTYFTCGLIATSKYSFFKTLPRRLRLVGAEVVYAPRSGLDMATPNLGNPLWQIEFKVASRSYAIRNAYNPSLAAEFLSHDSTRRRGPDPRDR